MSASDTAAQPANALEQRVYDLLRPFRKELFEEFHDDAVSELFEVATKLERKVLVLSQNIAFLAHNHIANTERSVRVEDIFIVMRGWTGDGVAKTGGAVAVLVRFPESTIGVLKASFDEGSDVIDALCAQVDEVLAEAF